MTITMLDTRADSMMTTDGTRRGSDTGGLAELTRELTSALNGAIWSFMLRADLEDALDTALLRAVMAETPTLSGAGRLASS